MNPASRAARVANKTQRLRRIFPSQGMAARSRREEMGRFIMLSQVYLPQQAG